MMFRSKISSRSAVQALDRMKILLTAERIHCSHQKINLLKKDLIYLLKKYFKIDEEQLKIEISQEPFVIHIKIPVKNIRTDDVC